MHVERQSRHAIRGRLSGWWVRSTRVSALAVVTVTAFATLTGCAASSGASSLPAEAAPAAADVPADAPADVERAPADASASSQPSPSATEQERRAMQVGDCLNKVDVDELGLPIPEFLDCAEPHMFEVTAIVTTSKAGATYDFDAIDEARKAQCRAAYESYTGRDPRDMGNAFGWDQLTEEAWGAGATDYPCYATAPGFADLTGSVAR